MTAQFSVASCQSPLRTSILLPVKPHLVAEAGERSIKCRTVFAGIVDLYPSAGCGAASAVAGASSQSWILPASTGLASALYSALRHNKTRPRGGWIRNRGGYAFPPCKKPARCHGFGLARPDAVHKIQRPELLWQIPVRVRFVEVYIYDVPDVGERQPEVEFLAGRAVRCKQKVLDIAGKTRRRVVGKGTLPPVPFPTTPPYY